MSASVCSSDKCGFHCAKFFAVRISFTACLLRVCVRSSTRPPAGRARGPACLVLRALPVVCFGVGIAWTSETSPARGWFPPPWLTSLFQQSVKDFARRLTEYPHRCISGIRYWVAGVYVRLMRISCCSKRTGEPSQLPHMIQVGSTHDCDLSYGSTYGSALRNLLLRRVGLFCMPALGVSYLPPSTGVTFDARLLFEVADDNDVLL